MRLWVIAGLCAAVFGFSMATNAAPPGASVEEERSPPIMTIVITPEWQPIDPQRASKTVNYYSGDELDAAGIRDSIDLQYKTPGLVFKTNAVLGQPYLRGVGSDIISAGSEAGVATFMDGVYLPRAFDSIVDFYDVERVEVIKGPQGVHLGRNVTGGAISIHTMDPVPYQKTAYADLLVGDYDKRQVRGAVNLPSDDSKLAVRLAGSAAKREGYSDNVFLNKDVDDEDYYAVRGKMLYAPSRDLSLLLSAERHREDSSRALAPQPDPGAGVNGGIALGGIVPDDPRQVTANVDNRLDMRSDRYSAKLTWNQEDTEFVSTTAWLRTEGALAVDLDNTNVDYSSNFPRVSSTAFMQEFRLAVQPPQHPLSGTVGVFFLRENADQMLDVRLPLFGVRHVPDGSVATRSYALFGQLAYQFSSGWRGKAGMRYSHDKRQLDLVDTLTDPLGVLGSPGTTVTRQNEGNHWRSATPEFGLEYAPHENRLYYVTAARGFKAGGYNTSGVQPAFDPESLWAYETGVKATWPEQRLRTNAALFYYDYKDMQLDTPPTGAPTGTFPIVINAAAATIEGADLDVLLQPARNTTLSLGATALFVARFDRFVSRDPNHPADDPDRSGKRLPQAPRLSLNARADYTWPLSAGNLTLGGEYRYQSTVYFNIYQDPAVRQGDYGIVNANLTYAPRKGDWYAELYGRNLTDKLYAQNIIRNDPLVGTLRFWGAPRTFGFRIGHRW